MWAERERLPGVGEKRRVGSMTAGWTHGRDRYNQRASERARRPISRLWSEMLYILRKIVFNKYFWLLFLPLSIGWGLLVLRVETRTNFAQYTQMESVKRIWGGNLEQPMPSIRYKGFGSDVSTLNRGELAASAVTVDIAMDYRKKGMVYYTGYNADFTGTYHVTNPQDTTIYLSFIFPYPVQAGQGMLQDVVLHVNGEEDVENTEYQQNLALWTGLLQANETLKFTVRYAGRGLTHFIYGFEPGTQINNFQMAAHVRGARNVDYPASTMTPTSVEASPDGVTLTWQLDRSLTELNVGVLLPDKLNIARQIGVMAQRAPVFYALFLISVAALLALTRHPIKFLNIAILSVTYFFFYPLFAYLSVYLTAIPAFALSFGILGLLLWNYARILYGLRLSLAILAAYALYLGVTSVAALVPTHTGLILVIEGVVLLAVAMQVLSHFPDVKWMAAFGLSAPPKSTRKRAAQPAPAPEPPPFEEK